EVPSEAVASSAASSESAPWSNDPFDGTPLCDNVISDKGPSKPTPRRGSAPSKEISYIVKYTQERNDLTKELIAPWGSKITLSPDNLVAIARASVLPCEPSINLSLRKDNPANVQTVMKVLPEAKWNELTTFVAKFEPPAPFDASTFSYLNFLRLVG